MDYKDNTLWVAVCPMTDLLLAEDGTWVESVALAKKWITGLGAEKAWLKIVLNNFKIMVDGSDK